MQNSWEAGINFLIECTFDVHLSNMWYLILKAAVQDSICI